MNTPITDVFSVRSAQHLDFPDGIRLLATNDAIRRMKFENGDMVRIVREDGTELDRRFVRFEERWGQMAVVIEGLDHESIRRGDMIVSPDRE